MHPAEKWLIEHRDQKAREEREASSNIDRLETARAHIDRHILTVMVGGQADGYFEWFAFHLSAFVTQNFDKEMARAACRSLTDRGFARYERSLWGEDGIPAGAGYRITEAGRTHLELLRSIPARNGEA